MATGDRGTGGGSRSLIIIVLVIAVIALVTNLLGLWNMDSSGKLEAPDVAVTGGSVPDVQVETADVDVGTTNETVKVPDVDIDVSTDDATVKVPTIDVNRVGDDDTTSK